MWYLIMLLLGIVIGAGGLFVWARYNKNNAIKLLNMDFEAKVDELRDKANEELSDLSDDAKKKLNDLLDELKN